METAIGLTILGMFLAVWGVFLNKQTTRVLEKMDGMVNRQTEIMEKMDGRANRQTEIMETMDERSVKFAEILQGMDERSVRHDEVLAGITKTLEAIAQLITTGQRSN